MGFELDHQLDQRTLSVTGEVDAATSPEFERVGLAAVAQTEDVLTVDLGKVSFIDSTGLQVLLTLNEAARRGSVRLVLADASQPVRHLLEIMKLDDFFDLAAS